METNKYQNKLISKKENESKSYAIAPSTTKLIEPSYKSDVCKIALK